MRGYYLENPTYGRGSLRIVDTLVALSHTYTYIYTHIYGTRTACNSDSTHFPDVTDFGR